MPTQDETTLRADAGPVLSDGLGAGPEARDKYAPGTPCTVNTSGDMFMMTDARGFFGVPCVVVKRTKAGLIQVARHGDFRHTYSFPQRNVDLLEAPNGMLAGKARRGGGE